MKVTFYVSCKNSIGTVHIVPQDFSIATGGVFAPYAELIEEKIIEQSINRLENLDYQIGLVDGVSYTYQDGEITVLTDLHQKKAVELLNQSHQFLVHIHNP